MEITNMQMSARTELTLRRAGITTLKELMALTIDELTAIRGMSRRSIREIMVTIDNIDDDEDWYQMPAHWPPKDTPVKVKVLAGDRYEILTATWRYTSWSVAGGGRLSADDVVGWHLIEGGGIEQ